MKPICVIALIAIYLCTYKNMQAQSINCSWLKTAGGANHDVIASIATDQFGNSYATGQFESPTITFGTITLNNTSSWSFFLVKYDSSGNVVWAKSSGGLVSFSTGNNLVIDYAGNILVTGNFSGSMISFGTQTIYSSISNESTFIVKFDTAGNALWAKASVNDYYTIPYAITVDGSGNSYISGSFADDSIKFGSYTLYNSTPGMFDDDFFIVKFNQSGIEQWAQSYSNFLAYAIKADTLGNVLATGTFFGPSATFGSIVLNGSAQANFCLVKMNASGNVFWGQTTIDTGGFAGVVGGNLEIDPKGNIYLSGSFDGTTATFGSNVLVNTNAGFEDLFITKYDSAGNVLWARSAGGINNEFAPNLVLDGEGNVYLAGCFESSSISFGLHQVVNNGAAGTRDIYLVKCDSLGNIKWAKSAGGGGDEYITKPGIYATDLILAGSFSSPSLTLGSSTLLNSGDFDLFIARSGSCSSFFTVYADTVPHNWIVLNLSSGVPPLNYSWNWGDGQTSSGSSPTHTYTNPSYYNICLEVTDGSGCVAEYCDSSTYLYKNSGNAMVTISVFTPVTTTIADPVPENAFSVYPNPANEQMFISLPQTNEPSRLVVFASSGQVVYEESRVIHGHFELNVSGLVKGIYFLKISSSNAIFEKKFIVTD